jgi:hypothetical protein
MQSLYEWLGLDAGSPIDVQDIHLLDWGRTLRLACASRSPDGSVRRFDLVFHDCRELKWRVYAFDDGRDAVSLVDARLGRGGHRSPAHLLTDRFGLTLTYGELALERDDDL